jgi:hypothetical protein
MKMALQFRLGPDDVMPRRPDCGEKKTERDGIVFFSMTN